MKHYKLKRKLVPFIVAASMTGGAYAQDNLQLDADSLEEAQDLNVDQIAVEEQVTRKRYVVTAESELQKARELRAKMNYEEAITHYIKAEQAFEQVSKSSPYIVQEQNVLKGELAAAYILFSEQLIEQAQSELSNEHFENAKSHINKAVEYNPELKAKSQQLLDEIAKREELILIAKKTQESVIYPEKQDDLNKIQVLKAEGKVFMHNDVWQRARDSFEKILLDHPLNPEAIGNLNNLYRRIGEAGKDRRRVMIQERLAEIEWKWVDSIPSISRTMDQDSSDGIQIQTTGFDGTQTLQEKLNSIIINKITFEDAPVTTVFEFLKARSRELDPLGNGVNFHIILRSQKTSGAAVEAQQDDLDFEDDDIDALTDDDISGIDDLGEDIDAGFDEEEEIIEDYQEPTVTVNFDNIPLIEAIRLVCQSAGLKYKVDEYVVSILGENVEVDDFELQFYKISPRAATEGVAGGGGDGGGFGDDAGFGGGQSQAVDWVQYFKDKGITFPSNANGEQASISYDRATSTLHVLNNPKNHRLISRIVQQINVTIPQITIESKFVEVRQDSLEELSFKWAFRGQVDGGPKTIQSGNVDVDWKPDGIAEDGLISSLANATRSVSQTVGGNLGSVFNLDTIIGNNQFTTLIYMFDRKSGTDVLSTPKVTVQSGEEAYIAMTEERQFAESFEEPEIETTGDGDNAGIAFTPATPNFAEAKEDLGVTLTVTPTVMDDGISIVLELHPKVVEFIGYDETFNVVLQYPVSTNPITGEVETLDIPYIYSTPVFEVREIRTKVTVWDGESVVLGGTIKDKVNKVNDKIPYLGDIPLLGRLFRSEGEQSEKRNLVIFVTARIIDPSGIPIRTINNNGLVDFRR